jgi:hypothetical protein
MHIEGMTGPATDRRPRAFLEKDETFRERALQQLSTSAFQLFLAEVLSC